MTEESCKIVIEVRLYGEMKCFSPGEQAEFKLKIEKGSTVSDVLSILKIPVETQYVVLLNGRRTAGSKIVGAHSILVLFPPISGG